MHERDDDQDDEGRLGLARFLEVPAHGADRGEQARVEEVTEQEEDDEQDDGAWARQVLPELSQLFEI